MIDVHLHTRYSFDSEESPENYIIAARENGVPALGFSEHYDFDAHLDGEDISSCDIDKYFKSIENLRKANPKLKILAGIEFGYRAEALKEYRKLTRDYPFDYVINSVHTLAGRGDCYHDKFFEGRGLRESYNDYFKCVLESVYADFDYQIIGHLGYVSRYRRGEGAKIKYEDYVDILDEILRGIIGRDKCLEINSSAGSSGSEFLPDLDIVERYLELGGKRLSFGSDAHKADRFLNNSGALADLLKAMGVGELYYYSERKPVPYKI